MRRLNTNPNFPALFQFIGKNKAIPEFLAQPVEELAPRLLALSDAIDAADTQAPIFSDPECSLLMLYLMQQNRFPFWEGITVYVYLIALMQFTDKQKLADKDQDIKRPLALTHVKLVANNELSEDGQRYIVAVQAQMRKKFGRELNAENLKRFILSLPAFEQLLLRINVLQISANSEDGVRLLSDILLNNLPFSRLPDDDILYDYYEVPGTLLLNYLLGLVPSSGQPMQMLPIFGQVHPETLSCLHQANAHPVSLYSPFISSNPRDADGHRGGPFFMWMHDVGHSFWASMLPRPMRELIFNEFIPTVQAWAGLSKKEGKEDVARLLERALLKAADFDLTRISDFAELTDFQRLVRYLRKTFDAVYVFCNQFELSPLGACPQDFIYFLLWRESCFQRDSGQYFWVSLAYSIPTGYAYRSANCVTTLKELASKSAKVPHLPLFSVFTKPISKSAESSRAESPIIFSKGNELFGFGFPDKYHHPGA